MTILTCHRYAAPVILLHSRFNHAHPAAPRASLNPALKHHLGAILGQPRQAVGHACLTVGKPGFRIERHGQSWYLRHRLGGNQSLFQIAVASGMRHPDIAGAERIP